MLNMLRKETSLWWIFLCLILFVFEIHPLLIIVNVVVAALHLMNLNTVFSISSMIQFTDIQDKKCWVKGV